MLRVRSNPSTLRQPPAPSALPFEPLLDDLGAPEDGLLAKGGLGNWVSQDPKATPKEKLHFNQRLVGSLLSCLVLIRLSHGLKPMQNLLSHLVGSRKVNIMDPQKKSSLPKKHKVAGGGWKKK